MAYIPRIKCGSLLLFYEECRRERWRRGFEIPDYNLGYFCPGSLPRLVESTTGAASSTGGETEMYLIPASYCGVLTPNTHIAVLFFAILRGMSELQGRVLD